MFHGYWTDEDNSYDVDKVLSGDPFAYSGRLLQVLSNVFRVLPSSNTGAWQSERNGSEHNAVD